MRTGTNRISNNDYVFAEQNVEELAVEGELYFYQTYCGTKLSVVKSSDFLHFAAHSFI